MCRGRKGWDPGSPHTPGSGPVPQAEECDRGASNNGTCPHSKVPRALLNKCCRAGPRSLGTFGGRPSPGGVAVDSWQAACPWL